MTIRELERKSGLERANIRFYEKEGLLEPERKENGYRDYSEEDLQLLMKIKLLRRLDFSVEAIRALKNGNTDLEQALERRLAAIGLQRRELNATEQVCQEMRQDGAAFPTLDARRYLEQYDRVLNAPSVSAPIRPAVPESDRIRPVRCPWRRYFARHMDMLVATTILWTILALIFRANISRAGGFVDWILGVVAFGLLIPLEGLLLSKWGTTPGKWLMGIRVEHEDGRKLTFGEAVDRTWMVFVKGLGFTIPFYSLYRLWKSYKAARDGNDDDLEWEWSTNSVQVVKERECPTWRPVVFAAAYGVLFFLSVWICLLPGLYPPNRGSQLTVEEFVENYNSMARFHGYQGDELQSDGTYGTEDVFVVTVGADSEELQLQFEEADGVLTKVSFERDISSWFRGGSVDRGGKQAILLTAMSYAWADSGPVKAYRSQKILEEFTQWNEGTLSRKVLGCELTYTLTSLGETMGESDGFSTQNWRAAFEFVPKG